MTKVGSTRSEGQVEVAKSLFAIVGWATADFVEALDFANLQYDRARRLAGDMRFYWTTTWLAPTGTPVIKARVSTPDGGGWVSVGFAAIGTRIHSGGVAVVATETSEPLKYQLFKDFTADPMAQNGQTLLDATTKVENGKLVMSFTRLLREEYDDVTLGVTGTEWGDLVFARGKNADFPAPHDTEKAGRIQDLDLSSAPRFDESWDTNADKIFSPIELFKGWATFWDMGPGSDKISERGFRDGLEWLGEVFPTTEDWFGTVDADGNGDITVDEFVDFPSDDKISYTIFSALADSKADKITVASLADFFGAFGREPDVEILQDMIASFDADGDRALSLQEFEQVSRSELTYDADELRDVFALFDKSGDGLVVPGELNSALIAFDQTLTKPEVYAIVIGSFDRDANVVIDEEEFLAALTPPPRV